PVAPGRNKKRDRIVGHGLAVRPGVAGALGGLLVRAEAALFSPRIQAEPTLVEPVEALAEAEETLVGGRLECRREGPRARADGVAFDPKRRRAKRQLLHDVIRERELDRLPIDRANRGHRRSVAPLVQFLPEAEVAGLRDDAPGQRAAGPADGAIAIARTIASRGQHAL